MSTKRAVGEGVNHREDEKEIMKSDSEQNSSKTLAQSGERASNERQLSSPSEREESVAFKAGRDARAQRVPITQSALRMIRPGTDRYYDFMDGYDYENTLRKRKRREVKV